MTVLITVNQKGGVGKTTTTITLAEYLAFERNLNTLIVDMEGQRSASLYYGIQEPKRSMVDVLAGNARMSDVVQTIAPTLHLAPATPAMYDLEFGALGSYALRNALATVRNKYDCILIDPPPALGPASMNGLAAADLALIVCQASVIDITAMRGFISQTLSRVNEAGLNPSLMVWGILLTMFHPARKLDNDLRATLVADGLPVFDVTINDRAAVPMAARVGQSIIRYQPRHPVSEAYRQVGQEFVTYASAA